MRVSERGEERIVTIYVDVLVALNLYVTWFLLLASEALSGRPCKRWRRGLAALAGGLSSLAIFLPGLPDDFLCFLAGTTGMSWKKFALITVTCRPLMIFAYSLGALGFRAVFPL